ncbi:MAG: sigma-70 family RNA polymerase sigma factor [Chloroflexi bacterium]|nr:sigma-70 family RNA polymerase sigma factor [Chloroflexota bacterium]
MDDRDLIASAQQGDRQAFTKLVCRHQGSVVSLIYRMCGDLRLAEDAAQEAFVRVWQNLKSYKPQYAFRSWLYRIATNVALDVLRRERPTADLDSLSMADLRPSPEQSAEDNERAAYVRRAIAQLSESLRVVLVLREYQDLSYQEIADALNIPIGTVMSRLNAARAQLRHELVGLLE